MLFRTVQDKEGVAGGERSEQRMSFVSDTLIEGFLRIHERVSDKLATPRRYVSFIHTYMHIYSKKKNDIQQKQQRLQVQYVSNINFLLIMFHCFSMLQKYISSYFILPSLAVFFWVNCPVSITKGYWSKKQYKQWVCTISTKVRLL
jgi:hypothetical protein